MIGQTDDDEEFTYLKSENLYVHPDVSQMKSVSINDLGSTYQVGYKDGSLAFWDEEGELGLYNILQFHVHAPSEHTFDGEHYDLELHIVHISPQ